MVLRAVATDVLVGRGGRRGVCVRTRPLVMRARGGAYEGSGCAGRLRAQPFVHSGEDQVEPFLRRAGIGELLPSKGATPDNLVQAGGWVKAEGTTSMG